MHQVQFSPDNSILASASADFCIRLWNKDSRWFSMVRFSNSSLCKHSLEYG